MIHCLNFEIWMKSGLAILASELTARENASNRDP
jgi:hypothetical protein